jgi:DNA ligase-1
MRAFAALYAELDASTATSRKLEALAHYLRHASPADAAWAVYVLAGGKPRQIVPTKVLRSTAAEVASLPDWLFDACYDTVGDLAETIARLLPDATQHHEASLADWMARLLALRGGTPETVRAALRAAWSELDAPSRFVFNKLITGGLRVGVSKLTVIRAIARVGGLEHPLVAQRLMGYTDANARPDAQSYLALIAPVAAEHMGASTAGQPYPFFLAHPLDEPTAHLGSPEAWQIEWKWDGIRAQVVLEADRCWIWSRGEELVTERFPELMHAARNWVDQDPQRAQGVVLDGEILAWETAADRPMQFAALQRRLHRRQLTPRLLREVPVVFVAYDLLQWSGRDWRERPLAERRAQLERHVGQGTAARSADQLGVSPLIPTEGVSWEALAEQRAASRALGVEGFMIKRRDSRYGVGRTRSDSGGMWWKWKVDPFSIDAVLIYAQRGHGRRASLYTDYTFAVWDRTDPAAPVLVPFAKAYSGLTDEEIRRVDAIVRKTTIESFGPVRSLTPTLVFELGFEGIAESPRHKSGIAVRFPRMLRWRTDKTPQQADSLQTLRALLVSFRQPFIPLTSPCD